MYDYDDVNKALAEVVEYLSNIENVWNDTRTLKLHDVSFHAGEIIEKYPLVKSEYNEYDLFTWFCDCEYDNFTTWMQENGITDCREYIGRTSSFYLSKIHSDSMSDVLNILFDELCYYYTGVDIDKDCKMIPYTATDNYTEAELIEWNQPDMEYIACGEFLEDVKKYLSDAIEIASYIDNFKAGQIESFTEYIECRNESLEDAAEQEKAERQSFIEKYSDAIQNIASSIEEVIKETGCNIADATRIISESMQIVTA